MSDSQKDRDPNDPSYRAPPEFQEGKTATTSRDPDGQALSMRPPLDDSTLRWRAFKGNEGRGDKRSDAAFAEALARLMRERREAERNEAPSFLHQRPSLLIGQLTVAVACAAVVAMAYVTLSSSQGAEGSVLRMWRSMKATLLMPPAPHRVSALVVRNVSGFVNQPMQLGVSVDSPEPGATVTIKGMPANARLTAGVPTGHGEWMVPAEEVSTTKIVPPSDFVGDMNVSAELHGADGPALVTSYIQLTWKPMPANEPPPAVTASTAPTQRPAQPAPPPPAAVEAKPPQPAASAAAPTETAPRLTANESAALVRRAQEILATGDVREARLLLIRAAEAHDPRAALMLAKTFDPTVANQLASSAPGHDLAQARGWYQKAREWGSPDAQRQLDALASYR